MADFGIKVSKPSINTGTAVDKDLDFTSKLQHQKVFTKGIGTSTSFTYAHNLNYPPQFSGYIKDGAGKYFLNYFAGPIGNFGSLSFENNNYGTLSVDGTNLYANCGTANALTYIVHANSLGTAANPNQIGTTGDVGFKFTHPGNDVGTSYEDTISLTSKLQSPLVISSGTAVVSVAEIGTTTGSDIYQTDITDVSHGQSQANHLICDDFYGASLLAFITFPTGIEPPTVVTDYEIYIDATKMRFRVSRWAWDGGILGGAYAPGTTVDFKWFLTNVTLP